MSRVLLSVALFAASGCVSKSTYEALQSQYDELSAQNEQTQQRLKRLEAASRARMQALEELRRDFQPLVDQGLLEISVEDGRVMIGMKADVLFSSGSAELSEEGKRTLQQVGRKLATRSDRDFQIEGHTDSDPIATDAFPDNWYLGAARAITVLEFLVESGMSREQLSAATFADTRPVGADKTLNRRIELVLLPDLSELPGYEEMMKSSRRPPRKNRHR